MLSKIKVFRYVGILLFVAMLGSILIYPVLKGESAATDLADAEKQMELLKTEMEQPNSSPKLAAKYTRLANILSDCSPLQQLAKPTIRAPFTLPPSLCINGALAVSDPNYNRVLMSSTGTGVGTGVVGNCSLSGSGTATEYDVYSFNLTGCTAFPTAVDVSLCSTAAGCVAPGALDSGITLYRNVPAGDPLTANGGLPAVFNPASPCTNARAANDDSGTTPTSPGGSTCSQTGSCLPQCIAPASTANSELRRNLGSGRFTVVVTGFGNATVGSYNLYVNAPAAGCNVALAPTEASAGISGQVKTQSGRGIGNAVVTINGGSLAEPKTARTSSFGYYSFEDLVVGETYTLTVASKRYTFTNSSQVVVLQDNATDVDFVSEQ